MTDKGTSGEGGGNKESVKDFFKPYRIKPVEVYVEPGPDGCAREKND